MRGHVTNFWEQKGWIYSFVTQHKLKYEEHVEIWAPAAHLSSAASFHQYHS